MNTNTKKIIAGLLSFAMVLTLVAGVAVSTADAQTASFSRNLTVGSRGADVTALQSILASKGFLSVSPTGYFGSLTKAALAAWQASVGITPAVGYFGPITRGQINMGTGPVGCTPGTFNPQTGQPCTPTPTVGCPTGALYNYMTGARCDGTGTTPTTLDNTDGSLTVSTSSVVPSATTIKKGETKDLIAARFTATAGKVAVTRFDVEVSERPWLTFSKFELVDQNTGAVVATKNLSGPSDVTEVTAGLKYLLRFEGLNYVVTPGTPVDLKVRGTVLASTDKVIGQNVTFTLTLTGIRTLNGKGYTDSTGVATTAIVTLSNAASDGTVTARVSTSNQPARIQQTSRTAQTNGVELLKLDLKAENTNSTINSLNFTVTTSGPGVTQVLKSVRLTDGSNTYYATIGTTTTFTNLNIALTKDAYKALTVVADVADQDEFATSTTVSIALSSTASGYDVDYTSISSIGGAAAGNTITLQDVAIGLTGVTASAPSVNTESSTTTAQSTFTFIVTNNSADAVYLSASTAALFKTSSVNAPVASSTGSVTASGGIIGGDSSGVHYIVAAGSSRTFSVPVIINDTNAAISFKDLKVTEIRYSDVTTNLTKFNISSGLENLKIEAAI